MQFHDASVENLDVKSSRGIQELVQVHLCGHREPLALSESDKKLVDEFLERALPAGISFEQLNELLLVLNQNRISRAFFDFFFLDGIASEPLTMDHFRDGVVRFKGFAMICFGNFRFAFRRLSSIENLQEFKEELGGCCRSSAELVSEFGARSKKVLDISPVEKDQTWFVGEITGNRVKEEIRKFEHERTENASFAANVQAEAFGRELAYMDEKFNRVQMIALRNTDVYLTWDHLDVYVATSMRNKWEFEETFEFTQSVFNHESVSALRLRHFDPTQSKCETSRDKGLLEGLMLKRARCTIYMVQETDTLGKDSELAITLAQGKPVIAYLPRINPTDFAAVISTRSLRYAKLRLLALQASDELAKVDGLQMLTRTFLDDLELYRKDQPFELWTSRDEVEFKAKQAYWPELCSKLANAEAASFDRRANVLRNYHPLGMQMDLRRGVANGVMVVRDVDKCAELLRAILTNGAEFEIRPDLGCRSLVEKISESVFRVVTDNEKLTNSFWNFWGFQEHGRQFGN